MSCLPDSSTTSEQRSSTCKDFYNYKLFAFLSHTLYISILYIFPFIILSCLYAFAATDIHPPNKNLFFRPIFSSSFIDFEVASNSSDIASKEGGSPWLGIP